MVEHSHRRQRPVFHGRPQLCVVLAPPLRPGDKRLVLGESLGVPPRHPRIRQLDREHMRELVPDHHAPVDLAHGRRHRGDHLAEAHPQRPQVGEPHGTHTVLSRILEELDDHRQPGRKTVALDHARERALKGGRDVPVEQVLFLVGVA